jgi:16S rRNA (adenine1518-N6/adenine1519-N6)-dimethyltransferase
MTNASLPALNIPALLRQYGLRPSKRLGQNFLLDESALQKIASIADIQPQDTVLEIGPGLGGLTRHLALAARQVVAVELDEGLFPALRAVLAPYANVRLIHADILKLRPADVVAAPDYLVVANIPYYITSALLRHLLTEAPRPRRLVLTVQEEVAERICATPGQMSLLALSVQVYGKAEIAARIPAGAFYPAPTVNSAVVLINIHPSPLIPYPLLDNFFWLAKAGFGQKRKTLRNALSAIMPREKAEQTLVAVGIDPQRRAETLRLEEWGKLSNQFSVTGRQ